MNKYTLSRVIVNRVHRKWRVILDFDGRGFTQIDFWDGERPQEVVARVRAWIDSFESQVVNVPTPTPGKWYWVKINGDWMPAMYDPNARSGWTNTDTWEDFNGEVVEWQEMVPPTTEQPAQKPQALTGRGQSQPPFGRITEVGQSPPSAYAPQSTFKSEDHD